MHRIFDAHAHIDPNPPAEPPPVRAGAVAFGRMLCAVEPDDWPRVASAAAVWPGTIPAYGVHPWLAAAAAGDWLERLEKILAGDPSAWLGEAGLDYLRTDRAPLETQEAVFAAQLQLARRLERPVNLHCVKAHDALIGLLDKHYLTGGFRPGFIVHSFAGPHQAIPELVRRGAYFTVGPLFSRRNSERHRRRAALLPADRLLLESDAFLVPPRNAAEDLLHALDWLSAVRQVPPDELAGIIGDNFRRMFAHG